MRAFDPLDDDRFAVGALVFRCGRQLALATQQPSQKHTSFVKAKQW